MSGWLIMRLVSMGMLDWGKFIRHGMMEMTMKVRIHNDITMTVYRTKMIENGLISMDVCVCVWGGGGAWAGQTACTTAHASIQ